ncbi:hypothetical protein [Pseudomonas sp. N040]|nr:hypothetical protein [Pseudomonas sp. N040]MBF7729832.1 hypothetical protein [Pseudomonas sp. N040]MBW7013474.1 hypothetical protein [Pseudomonas sp. N040]
MSFLKKTIKIAVVDLILMNILVTVAIISTGHLVSYLIGYVPLALGGNQ